MKILITGGAGFIGSHVASRFVAKGHEVRVLDDLSTGRRENLPSRATLLEKSVSKIEREDVSGCDCVVHCAAQVSTFTSITHPSLDFSQNAVATFRLLESLRKYSDNARIILTSSRSVLGDIPDGKVADEESDYRPLTIYGANKTYAEILCQVYSQLYGIRYTIIRPSNVYGPGQPYWTRGTYNFIAYWFKLAIQNQAIPIYGDGKQVRDYVYIDDVSKAFLSALQNKRAIGEIFLLSTGRGTSLLELADLVLNLTKSSAGLRFLPMRKGDFARFVGRSEKARRVIGWQPAMPLVKGLKRELEWVKKEVGPSATSLPKRRAIVRPDSYTHTST